MNINTVSQPGLVPTTIPTQQQPVAGRTTVAPHPFSTLLHNVHGPLTHNVPNAMRSEANSLNAHAFANRAP
jgi:hypothetical protein